MAWVLMMREADSVSEVDAREWSWTTIGGPLHRCPSDWLLALQRSNSHRQEPPRWQSHSRFVPVE